MKVRRILAAGLAAALMAAASGPSFAGVQYVYDSSGRLIRAIYSNGITIEYRYDAAGNRTQIVTTNVPNSPPNAVNDTAAVNALASVDIQVRLNDSDPNGNSLTVTAVSAVSGGGSAQIMGGGAYVRYTAPATGGTKTFTYTISDGAGGTDTATVTVTVTAASQPPIAVDDSAFVPTNQAVSIMVRANDSDPNNDPLTVISTSNVSGGSVSIAPGGTYVIYYAPAEQGSYSFQYTISDGNGGTDTAYVWVEVQCDMSGGQQCDLGGL